MDSAASSGQTECHVEWSASGSQVFAMTLHDRLKRLIAGDAEAEEFI